MYTEILEYPVQRRDRLLFRLATFQPGRKVHLRNINIGGVVLERSVFPKPYLTILWKDGTKETYSSTESLLVALSEIQLVG